MIHYSTNLMGPINLEWIKKNGDNWSSGRIDVYGDRYESEMGLPPMDWKDWDQFSQWLDKFKSEKPLRLEELVKLYEETNSKITWFRTPEWQQHE